MSKEIRMNKKTPILILLVISFFSAFIFAQRGLKVIRTSQGKEIALYKGSYALIVGNSKYTSGWDPLPAPEKDVEELRDILRRIGFEVTLVKNVDKGTFLSELSNFTYKYGQDKDNQLLFYYAGHGHTIPLASGEELGVLVMVDATLPEKEPQDFYSKSVDMKSIITWALKMKSKHVLFMFDSCFSGTVLNLRDRVKPKAISDAVMYPVRQFITAGRADEPVPDRSVFKQLFIDILEGRVEEPIKDGYITGEELGLFLKNKVPEYNKFQHPQYGKIRDPSLDKGDFVFVLESKKATIPVEGSKSHFPNEGTKPPFPKETEKLDLSAIKEPARQREKVLERWDDWQNKMDSDYRIVENFDKNPFSTLEEKKAAWELFLEHYEENNPYTTKDDELRQRVAQELLKNEREEALERWNNWQDEMNSNFQKVEDLDKNPVSTRAENKAAWEIFLRHYDENNPFATKDDELRKIAEERIKVLSKVEVSVGKRVSLRSKPRSLNDDEVKSMLKRRGFFDDVWNKSGDFNNKYEVKKIYGENVIIDHATGLMWHQSGSEKSMKYSQTKQWIDKLNSQFYAGYRDWRLPTLEEAASLLERRRMKGDRYINSRFSVKQSHIWTGDKVSGRSLAWVVNFIQGDVHKRYFSRNRYVRPVRSGQK